MTSVVPGIVDSQRVDALGVDDTVYTQVKYTGDMTPIIPFYGTPGDEEETFAIRQALVKRENRLFIRDWSSYGNLDDSVLRQWNLSNGVLSSASLAHTVYQPSEDMLCLTFNDTGTMMVYIETETNVGEVFVSFGNNQPGITFDVVWQTLSTPWDISTAGAVNRRTFAKYDILEITAIQFSIEGDYFYVAFRYGENEYGFWHPTNFVINRYPLTTPWDPATIDLAADQSKLILQSLDATTQGHAPLYMVITDNGRNIYGLRSFATGDVRLQQYAMAKPWDLTTVSGPIKTLPYGNRFKPGVIATEGDLLFVERADSARIESLRMVA